MAKQEASELLTVEGREIRITHPDKLYFSEKVRVTKLDLVRYYLSVAPGALSGIQDRPIVLKRFVNGAEQPAFYQKRAPEQRPSWLRTVTLSFPSGRTAEEIVVDDDAGLTWIVNLACIAALAGLERWKEKHGSAIEFLAPEDVLVDSMRGRSSTWARIRI